MRALGDGLGAHCASGFFQQRLVEGAAEGGAAGEAGRRDTVEEFGAADAVGAVGHAQGWDAMLGEGLGVPEVDAYKNAQRKWLAGVGLWLGLELVGCARGCDKPPPGSRRQQHSPDSSWTFSVMVSFLSTSSTLMSAMAAVRQAEEAVGVACACQGTAMLEHRSSRVEARWDRGCKALSLPQR